jgi:epoxyqueuosine reductase QueG
MGQLSALELTELVKRNAIRYGFDMVGIVKAETLDAVPSHYIAHRDYRVWTKKTTDYLEDARSVIILGARVWDNLFDVVIKVRGRHEYPDEWRGRLYARRMMRFLGQMGFKTVLEPDLLSKKRMAQLGGIGGFGKNSLIIHPEYGPWVRLRSILTDAELAPDEPYEVDPCGGCDECVKACPVGALTPYKVDPDKCLLGMTWEQRMSDEYRATFMEHCPSLTENTWLMCSTCQRACPVEREERNTRTGRAPAGQ